MSDLTQLLQTFDELLDLIYHDLLLLNYWTSAHHWPTPWAF